MADSALRSLVISVARADMMALCAVLAEQNGELPVSALLRAPKPREAAALSLAQTLEHPCSGSIHDVEAHPASPPVAERLVVVDSLVASPAPAVPLLLGRSSGNIGSIAHQQGAAVF